IEDDPSAEHSSQLGGSQGSVLRAWGRLPNSVAEDLRLSAPALALLAFYLTKTADFFLSEAAAKRGLPLSKRARGRKIGNHALRKQQNELIEAGYLQRSQPKAQSGRFGKGVERVALPPGEYHRRVYESWQNGSLSGAAIGVLIYVRASNLGRSRKQIQYRFDASKSVVGKALRALMDAGLVLRIGQRSKGQYESVIYRDAATKPRWPRTAGHNSTYGVATGGTVTGEEGGPILKELKKPTDRRELEDGTITDIYSHGDKFGLAAVSQSSLLSEALANRKHLGWIKALRIKGDWLALVEHASDDHDELHIAVGDKALACWVFEACDGLISQDLLDPSGIFSIRRMAAMRITALSINPQDGLKQFLKMVGKTARRGSRWLNSLELVGLPLVAQIRKKRFADLRSVVEEIHSRDISRLLADHLAGDLWGLNNLLALAPRDVAITAILEGLHNASINGKRVGEIMTWRYFEDAIRKEARKAAIADVYLGE
ncbi:MAG: hypothetical protein KDJ36_10890, partial [Hyphomicrobiaceae bacterium]|nr:hypothetical protein [Hyphomicrobiaceae bacterium]